MTASRTTGEDLLTDLAAAVDIPPERYESADRSYKSVSEWLSRSESKFFNVNINVYTQGSFRLGTPIRPITGEEDYDLDIVSEFGISKLAVTQQELHAALGYELKLYAKRYGMEVPQPWQRCWTLNYADNAQFHMDVLPSVPDGDSQLLLLEKRHLATAYARTSIAITDGAHQNYRRKSDEWPVSNPNGYASWFYQRMASVFDKRRKAMMVLEKRADVAEIPSFRVKTPLQSSIQILKRHRDTRFSERLEQRPSSIVLTTLAAHAYNQEETISGALLSILSRMDQYVEDRNGLSWIANPSDPRENFADSWNDDPKQKAAFFDWLQAARSDFSLAAASNSVPEFVAALSPHMGRQIIEKIAEGKSAPTTSTAAVILKASTALRRIMDAPHRKPPIWQVVGSGRVQVSATYERDGFRPAAFSNNGPALPSNVKLRFEAKTDIEKPFRVYWQIVNTGNAAEIAHDLRGGFEESRIEAGTLTKIENTKYLGSHSIECFIVRNGYCLGRSGLFVVNIQ